jgi:hypothetical protein
MQLRIRLSASILDNSIHALAADPIIAHMPPPEGNKLTVDQSIMSSMNDRKRTQLEERNGDI